MLRLIVFSHFSEKLVQNRHFAPPSTTMLEQTIATAKTFLGIQTEGGILFHDETWHCDGDRMEYALAVTDLGRKWGMKVLQPYERFGYRAAFLSVADYLKRQSPEPSDLYAWIEHDWEFLLPVNMRSVRKMLERDDCNYVKFVNQHDELERFKMPPHPCTHFARDVDRRNEVDVVPETIGFMRDSLFSTNPHVGKISKLLDWAQMVRENLFQNRSGTCNTFGLEEVLADTYFKDIDSIGFDEAHNRWGVWLALNGRGFDKVVRHTGV